MAAPAFVQSSAADAPLPEVTVIIPTLADAPRSAGLLRAIASVQAASAGLVAVLVVVNGQCSDAATLRCIEALGATAPVRFVQIGPPSAPVANAHGRSLVSTPFFAFLDDDDELLAGGLDKRLDVMRRHPSVDVVASNGWRMVNGVQTPTLTRLQHVAADPMRALFDENWLPSCGALFRTASVGNAYFTDPHPYAEWTLLAFRLALDGKCVRTVDEPTFVINDTPASLSKSAAYRVSYVRLYERMLESRPPAAISRLVRTRLSAALHDMAGEHLQHGESAAAWRCHLHSLVLPRGLRYLSFSRHLLRALWRPASAGT